MAPPTITSWVGEKSIQNAWSLRGISEGTSQSSMTGSSTGLLTQDSLPDIPLLITNSSISTSSDPDKSDSYKNEHSKGLRKEFTIFELLGVDLVSTVNQPRLLFLTENDTLWWMCDFKPSLQPDKPWLLRLVLTAPVSIKI